MGRMAGVRKIGSKKHLKREKRSVRRRIERKRKKMRYENISEERRAWVRKTRGKKRGRGRMMRKGKSRERGGGTGVGERG